MLINKLNFLNFGLRLKMILSENYGMNQYNILLFKVHFLLIYYIDYIMVSQKLLFIIYLHKIGPNS